LGAVMVDVGWQWCVVMVVVMVMHVRRLCPGPSQLEHEYVEDWDMMVLTSIRKFKSILSKKMKVK